MPIRTSTEAGYQRVLTGLRFNLARLVTAGVGRLGSIRATR